MPLIFCQKCEIVFCSNCINFHKNIEYQSHKNTDNPNIFIKDENIRQQNELILNDLAIFKKNNLDNLNIKKILLMRCQIY